MHIQHRGVRALLLTVAAATSLLACRAAPATEPTGAAPVSVQVAAVQTGPIRSVLTYSGAIQSSQQVNLTARVPGQVAAIYVDTGTTVKTGDRLASLDPGTLPAQVQQARANVDAAQARMNAITTGSRTADIAAAQSAYNAAQARLNQLLSPSATDRATVEAAVTAAEVTLKNAKAAEDSARSALLSAVYIYCNTWPTFGLPCDNIQIPLPRDVIESVQSSLQSRAGDPITENGTRANAVLAASAAFDAAHNAIRGAEDSLAAAQARQHALLNPSPADLATQRAAVDQARAALELRQNPYTDSDVQAAAASLAQAQAALAVVSTTLDQTNVYAPFDGVVAQRLMEVGAAASSATPIFVLSAKAVEVRLTIEESRIALVRPGLDADLTVAAFPGKTFAGKVSSIAPTADARAHTFEVKVHAADADSQLRAGMFAEVSMVTAQKSSALLVPSNAVTQQPKGPAVFMVVDGKATLRPVQLGISDQTNTEIVSGLKAGDQIVVVGQNAIREGQSVTVATGAAGMATPPAAPVPATPPTAPTAPANP